MDVDGEILVLARGALRLLRTRTATLAASDVGVGSIPHIQTDEVECLASRTEVAVGFGKIGEAVGTVERAVLAQSAVPRAHIGSDVPLQQPLQKLAIAVGGIGGHRLRFPSLPLGETSDHVLCGHGFLAHAGRRPLYPHDHTAGIVDQVVVVVPQPSRRASLWWRRWNRDRWSIPGLARAPVL